MLPTDLAGRYEEKRKLGAGGMAQVYEAIDRQLGRQVAIKIVDLNTQDKPFDAELRARFRREARAIARLPHPNIVTVYDYGENAESAWIVMELIDGGSLQKILSKNSRIEVSLTLRIMDAVCAALIYAHDNKIIHRDIKPGNIMLGSKGEIKVADFGIARIDDGESTSITNLFNSGLMGSPAYMPPEIIQGHSATHLADIWSTGVVLYILLTGRRPFEGGSPSALMASITHTPAQPPSQILGLQFRAFDEVIARALAKDPAHRIQSALDLIRDIRLAAAASVKAPLSGLGDDTTVPAGQGYFFAGAAPPPPAKAQNATTRASPDGPQRPPRSVDSIGIVLGASLVVFLGLVAWSTGLFDGPLTDIPVGSSAATAPPLTQGVDPPAPRNPDPPTPAAQRTAAATTSDVRVATPFGFRVENLTASIRRQFRVPDDASGVIVIGLDTRPGAISPSVQVGDVIQSIGATPITTTAGLVDALRRRRESGTDWVELSVIGPRGAFRSSWTFPPADAAPAQTAQAPSQFAASAQQGAPSLVRVEGRPLRIGDFGDWTAAVLTETGQKVCYAFTRAIQTDPRRDNVTLTVTHRAQGRDQVALSAGYSFPRNAAVTVAVGQTQLAFYTSGSSAFARDGRAVVAAFRAGAIAVSRGPLSDGRGNASDSFSLTGFTAAYEAISQECPAGRQ